MTASDAAIASQRSQSARIPLAAKIAYTVFVAVLVPVYWRDYGPTNFLYFCDVALLMAVAAMWLESPLLASMPAVGITLPQTLWQVDFIAGVFGLRLTGMTDYMFDPKIPFFTRALSFFHFWLPILLLWIIWRIGYDRRAYRYWSVLALVLIAICYLLLPAPPAPPDNPNLPVNVNYVYGMSDQGPQQWMDQNAFVLLLAAVLTFVIFYPTHVLLSRLAPTPVKPLDAR